MSRGRVAGPLWAVVLWTLVLAPAGWLLWRMLTGRLGANPVETLTLDTGHWMLRFLLLTLAATPLRRLCGWSGLLRHRRLLGLAAAGYGVLHLLVYVVLDQGLLWSQIGRDIVERPFITAGVAGLVLLLPLAVTSFDAAIRWLGTRRWQALHRLVYLATALALLHFWWKVKADTREPLIYAAVFGLLLAARFLTEPRRACWRRSSG